MIEAELEFLRLIPDFELRALIRRYLPDEAIRSDLERDLQKSSRVLFSQLGYSMLSESRIRRALLASLDDEEVHRLADLVNVDCVGGRLDLEIAISRKPWRYRAPIVDFFSRRFNVPVEFLPSLADSQASTEVIEPIYSLPDLFDYQIELRDKVVSFVFDRGRTATLLQLPTGAGKTRATIEAISTVLNRALSQRSRARVGVLWLGHTRELCDQAAESFERVWSAKGASAFRLSRFFGDHRPSPAELLNSFIVASYQKLAAQIHDEQSELAEISDHLILAVLDEGHKAAAPSVRELVRFLKHRGVKILGLSATPGRSSADVAENKRLVEIYEDTLLVSDLLGPDPISTLQQRGILATIERVECQSNVSISPRLTEPEALGEYFDVPNALLKFLANHRQRDELIIDKVISEVQAGHSVLVFACTVEHSKRLAALLSIRGIMASAVHCDMRVSHRQRVIASFRAGDFRVLTNFGVLSTGFDAPNIGTIMVARPTTSVVLYSQMIGRGLRGPAVGGFPVLRLVDVRDNFESFGDVNDVYRHFAMQWS